MLLPPTSTLSTLSVDGDTIVSSSSSFSMPVAAAVAGRTYEATYEHHHEPTVRLDGKGQGKAHVSFAFAAHRAVVDVDPDLGLVRVVDITTTQDVGRILNPVQAVGQIEGGIAQGVGLAVMEEIIVDKGKVRNASFTDYLIPTALDMPTVTIAALDRRARTRRPLRRQGHRRTPDHRLHRRRRGSDPERHRQGAPASPGPPAGHHRRLTHSPLQPGDRPCCRADWSPGVG